MRRNLRCLEPDAKLIQKVPRNATTAFLRVLPAPPRTDPSIEGAQTLKPKARS
jgi:hypothetical protein